jgi:AcrR family transcriptional regulator
MGIRERRERERTELREKILDAARELFVAEGYEAVTMRKIAERIEYSPTAIYLHFKDKESVLRELCDTDFLTLARNLGTIARIADPVERLRETGFAYARFAQEHPNHYRLMFMTPHPHANDESAIAKGNPEEDAYAFLRETVAAGIAAGRFRADLQDSELIAQGMWAAVHGVVSLQIAKCNDDWIDWCPTEDLLALVIDGLLCGLGVGSAPARKPARKTGRRKEA